MSKLLIKNAHFIDGNIFDIYIENNIIKTIGTNLNISSQRIPTIYLHDDEYISSGWIDSHTHCFEKFEIYADNCEEIGYRSGVTTVIDAGTAGADNIEEFYNQTKNCITHVYSLLNISKTGIYAQNELSDMNHIDIKAFQNAYLQYPNFIIGVKARLSKSVIGSNGDLPLYKAIEIANLTDLPLMVHIGTAPLELSKICQYLRPKDIITHIYNPKENGIWDGQHIKPCVLEAYQKGIYFDLGHGTDSFSFDILNYANQNHLKVYSISSDIYHRNRKNGPVYDLATTMTKLYHHGYSLKEVIDCVTIHPANMFHLHHIGKIEKGYQADFTIFKLTNKAKKLIDSTGKSITVSSYIQPTAVIINSKYIQLKEKNNG